MKAAASTNGKLPGGMHIAVGASVWVAKPLCARKAGHRLAECLTLRPRPVLRPRIPSRAQRAEGLDLVLVLHDQQVGKVQAGGLDLQQYLAGAWLGCGLLGPLQGLDPGWVVPCMHIVSPIF